LGTTKDRVPRAATWRAFRNERGLPSNASRAGGASIAAPRSRHRVLSAATSRVLPRWLTDRGFSCGRACTTLAPTGRRRRSYPDPTAAGQDRLSGDIENW